MTRSLKDNLLLTYLGLVLLALALPGLYLTFGLRAHEIDGMRGQLTSQALLAAGTVGRAIVIDGTVGRDEGSPAAQELVSRLKAASGSRVTLIDTSGRVLADSDRPAAEMENHSDRPEVAEALAGRTGSASRLSRTTGLETLYVASPVTESPGARVAGVIRFSRPLREVEASLFGLWKTLALTMAGAGLLAVLISLRLAGNFTDPIREVTWVANRIGEGDYSRRVFPRQDDETGQLGSAVNRMAETIEATMGELKGEKELLEAILGSLRAGVAFLGPQGTLRWSNPAFSELLDIAVPPGRSHWEVLQNYELSDLIERVRSSGNPETREFVLHQSGDRHQAGPHDHRLKVQIIPVRESGGLLLVVDDLTEVRRLEKVRAELVASVSHELRTPVTSIKGFAETLLEDGLEDKPQALEFLAIVDKEAGRLARLIEDLLQLSKLESGALEMRLARLEIGPFLAQVLSKVRPQAEKMGIALGLESQSGIWVEADSDRLEQVFLNLLDNALKHTPAGGSVRLAARRERNWAEITVEDTGSGIPREALERIFERFYRVDPARSRKTGGSGLGLAIAKHLVEAQAGRITVESPPGQGAKFTITFVALTPPARL